MDDDKKKEEEQTSPVDRRMQAAKELVDKEKAKKFMIGFKGAV